MYHRPTNSHESSSPSHLHHQQNIEQPSFKCKNNDEMNTCKVAFRILLCALALVFVFVFWVYWTTYNQHYNEAQYELLAIVNRAKEYMASDLCTPERIARTGILNKCQDHNQTVHMDINGKAHNIATLRTFKCDRNDGSWCAKIYEDIFSMTKFIIVVVVIALMVCWYAYISVDRSFKKYAGNLTSLPQYSVSNNKLQ